MTRLSVAECNIVNAIQPFVRRAAFEILDKDVERIISSFDHIQTDTIDSCANTRYTENPLNAYHLIKRFVNDWKVIKDILTAEDTESRKELDELRHAFISATNQTGLSYWPKADDLRVAAISLLRLVYFYQLDLPQLFNGRIYNTQVKPLSTMDLFFIARQAELENNIEEGITWLEALLRKEKLSSDFNPDMVSKIARALASDYFAVDMLYKSVEVLESLPGIDDTKVQDSLEMYRKRIQEKSEDIVETQLDQKKDNSTELYAALCRSNQKEKDYLTLAWIIKQAYYMGKYFVHYVKKLYHQTAYEMIKLKCFYRSTRIPYYRSKEEIVNFLPRISLFHDVISKTESQVLRKIGEEKLAVSSVVAGHQSAGRNVNFKVRISETAWVHEQGNPVLTKLTHRVGLITGLQTEALDSLSAVEPYQVLNYGIGGMYNPHHDFFSTPLWGPPFAGDYIQTYGSGDRIATWIFYLSDVTAGGSTVFPRLRTRVPVVEGSAAFWYNLMPSGEPDFRTEHAGCPVLLGSKWGISGADCEYCYTHSSCSWFCGGVLEERSTVWRFGYGLIAALKRSAINGYEKLDRFFDGHAGKLKKPRTKPQSESR